MATEGHAMPSVTSLFAGWVIFNFVLKDSGVKMHLYTQGEVTSQSLWSRYDRHFVGITRYNASSYMAKICRVIQLKLNQLL